VDRVALAAQEHRVLVDLEEGPVVLAVHRHDLHRVRAEERPGQSSRRQAAIDQQGILLAHRVALPRGRIGHGGIRTGEPGVGGEVHLEPPIRIRGAVGLVHGTQREILPPGRNPEGIRAIPGGITLRRRNVVLDRVAVEQGLRLDRLQLRLVELVAESLDDHARHGDLAVEAELEPAPRRYRVGRRHLRRWTRVRDVVGPCRRAQDSVRIEEIDGPGSHRTIEDRDRRVVVTRVEDEAGGRRVGLALVIDRVDEERVGAVGNVLGDGKDEDAVAA
jgi:hypothetical protein